MIEFDNVHKRFRGGQVGLQGIDLRISSGDMVFVTGHSGAGKSTLMRLMVLLDRCTSGVLRVGGQDLSSLRGSQIARYRRRVGVVFQEHRLIEDMTIAENVGLPLVVAGMSNSDVQRRVRAALDRVGLLGKEQRFPSSLSVGEQQRVGIARAVVHKPNLLLADEPTGNLDPELSYEIMRLFGRFNEVGVTVVVASHDLHLVGAFGKRRIVLREGQIIDDTMPE